MLGEDNRSSSKNISPHENIMPSASLVRNALVRTGITVLCAIIFGLVLGMIKGSGSCLEFFSGYLVEQSLSVDNLFVFIMLFEYFRVPPEFQQRVLSWGIAGAVLMRGIMIVAGVAAVRRFRWMTLLFAGILMLSSVKLLMESDDDESDLTDNFVVKLSRRLVGGTSEYDGDRFFTECYHHLDDTDDETEDYNSSTKKKMKKNTLFSKAGIRRKKRKKVATPLLLTLVCVELSDVVFAVDSIPAVLGISTDPLVVYSSNIFAIIGLRALYTLVAKAVDSMVYLKPAVCIVLLFISFKMILEYFDYHLSTHISLAVVVLVLGFGALLSLCHRAPNTKKHESPSISNMDINGDNPNTAFPPPIGPGYTTHRRPHHEGVYSPANDVSKVLV